WSKTLRFMRKMTCAIDMRDHPPRATPPPANHRLPAVRQLLTAFRQNCPNLYPRRATLSPPDCSDQPSSSEEGDLSKRVTSFRPCDPLDLPRKCVSQHML